MKQIFATTLGLVVMLALIGATPVSAQRPIPEATKPCSPEVAKWWQDVRSALTDFVAAERRRYGILSDQERTEIYASLAAAKTKYLGLMREGKQKSYSPPIEDSASPIFLYSGRPNYTERARANKTQGRVDLQVEYRADGTVGEVKIVGSGLEDGLNDQAIEAVREVVFLPAVKNGVFTTVWKSAFTEFNLR
jgi:TonB family protein